MTENEKIIERARKALDYGAITPTEALDKILLVRARIAQEIAAANEFESAIRADNMQDFAQWAMNR